MEGPGRSVRLLAPRPGDAEVLRALDHEDQPTSWRRGDRTDPWRGWTHDGAPREPRHADRSAWSHADEAAPRPFTIETSDGRAVGRALIDRIVPVHRRGRVTVEVLADARGRGVGTAALAALCEQGFDQLELHRLWAEVRDDADDALRIAARCGFRADSRRIGERAEAGRRHDVLVLSRLATDGR